jgi:hypothetical protein
MDENMDNNMDENLSTTEISSEAAAEGAATSLRDLILPDHLQLEADEYHAHPAVGSSQLKKILRSPAHYKAELEEPSATTAPQRLGSLIHLAILEPKKFEKQAVICPKFTGKGSRIAAEMWKQENQGKLILQPDEAVMINKIIDSLSQFETGCRLLSQGTAEESFFWQDPLTGIVCKCRPDFFKDGMLVDLKTTVNASPQDFPKSMANLMYHLQAAYYLDGVSYVLGEPVPKFVILAIEKEAPFAMAAYELDEATLDVGRVLYRRALKRLRQCRLSGEYPGYPDRILNASLPSWAWPSDASLDDYDYGPRTMSS